MARLEAESLNIVSLVRGGERYTIVYPDSKWLQATHVATRWVNDPDLAFNSEDEEEVWEKIVANRPHLRKEAE